MYEKLLHQSRRYERFLRETRPQEYTGSMLLIAERDIADVTEAGEDAHRIGDNQYEPFVTLIDPNPHSSAIC